MHEGPETRPTRLFPYVLLFVLTVALAAPLIHWSESGSNAFRPTDTHATAAGPIDIDPDELARAWRLVDELEYASEVRFLESRRARVSSPTPSLAQLLVEGDFERERVRGEDYASASTAWLRDIADLPRRASSALTLAKVPREVRQQIVAELECLVPVKLRAGRARQELGDSYVKYIDFVENHRDSMRYNEAGGLDLDHAECAEEFNRLTQAVSEAAEEVEERGPPLEFDRHRLPDA
jgi:hypothetical protein